MGLLQLRRDCDRKKSLRHRTVIAAQKWAKPACRSRRGARCDRISTADEVLHAYARLMAAALSSLARCLRAQNIRVLTVLAGIPTIAATSAIDFSW
jgi:hypothetical protein